MIKARPSWNRAVLVYTASSIFVVLTASSAARAATINVTTTNMTEGNGDGCSLIEAVRAIDDSAPYFDCAGGNGNADTVALRTGIGTYTLPRGIQFHKSVVLASATAGSKVSIKMASDESAIGILPFFQPVNLEVRDIILQGTGAPDSAGVYADGSIYLDGTTAEKVTLTRSQVFGFGAYGVSVQEMNVDIVDSAIELNGGGIFFISGTKKSLNVRFSQISNNRTNWYGGGIYFSSGGSSSVVNSTIAQNNAVRGGGLYLDLQDSAARFQITASTVAFNSADEAGGGAYAAGLPNYLVSETILGNNTAPQGSDWFGTITSLTNSLLQSRANNTLGTSSHNQVGVDPRLFLDSPGYAGGKYDTGVLPLAPPTATVPNPSINWNSSSSQTEDQRHFPRGVGSGSTRFDIGAYEWDPNVQTELLNVVTKSSDTHTNFNAPEFSNGVGTNLQSDAVGDSVTYQFPMIRDECVSIYVGVRRTKESAQVQLEYNLPFGADPNGWSPLGPVLDLWASTAIFKELAVVSSVKVLRDATRLRFRVVGRNNANTTTTKGYQMFLDYVRIANPVAGAQCRQICKTPPCPLYQ